MTREKFLTVRWNNYLSLAGGLLLLLYVVVVLATGLLAPRATFIGLVVIGSLYWLIVEGHTALRFAWLKKTAPDEVSVNPGCATHLIRQVFNAAWWLPIVLTLLKVIDYRTGFLIFGLATVARLVANLYVNNALTPEQAESFPFRA